MNTTTTAAPEYRDEERLDLPSASGFEITVQCPGSVRLKRSLPEDAFRQKDEDEDEWAQAGTRIHAAFETGNTLELSPEESETYRKGVENEKAIVEKWMRDKNLSDCEEGPREMRVWLHDPLNFPELLGSVKLDRHYINRKRGCVLCSDLKSGFNPNLPPSPRSWQLRFAAVALFKEEYGSWMKEARVGYCKAQSKVTASDFCDYTLQDLEYSWQAIQFHLYESTQPDAQLRAGPHCNWCPCKAYCIMAGAYSMLPVEIAKEDQVAGTNWESAVQCMSPQNLVKIWEMSSVAGKIIDAVKRRIKSMSLEEIAGMGLEFGKGRRLDPISDTVGAFKMLSEHFAVEDILKCAKISKTTLTELVASEQSKGKEEAGRWIDSKLDPYITRCTSEAPIKRIKGV